MSFPGVRSTDSPYPGQAIELSDLSFDAQNGISLIPNDHGFQIRKLREHGFKAAVSPLGLHGRLPDSRDGLSVPADPVDLVL
jgi:hypothetical protein